jgi:creatinine amidohydrolase/Fe(II)-dependent formamide hydrolase-like protein
MEGHGPHLPLGVDYFNAVYFAESIAGIAVERRPDFRAVMMPAIPLGAGVYRQPGSVRISNGALYELVKGLGESLATWNFRYIFFLSGHGSPKHIVAIESACLKVSRKHKINMHNLTGNLAIRFLKGEFLERISALMPQPLGDEDREHFKSDIHGGWWETSMMLLLRPDLVDANYLALPSVKRDAKAGNSESGYYGSPALANRGFAEASIKVMADEASEIVERILAGDGRPDETISPLYRMLPLRPHFRRNLVAISVAITILVVILIIALI